MTTIVDGDSLLKVVENYIKENKVMVFSKSGCPHCTKVKELFKSLGVAFYAVELDALENGAEVQQAMARKAGRHLYIYCTTSTVPQVFNNEQHIGSSGDTVAAP